MGKFIIGTFLLLGWGFYEMSGGADFVPETRVDVAVAVADNIAVTSEVTRADTTSLTALAAAPASLTLPVRTVQDAPAPAAVETPVVADVAASIVDATPAELDLRAVSGARVNMRSGPGTDYGVVDTLTRGTAAEVIEIDGAGWAKIRVIDTDQEGWMALRLLTES